jgi:hypothetical protein
MLRIILSRAALFPWLGIALMAAGAAFPEGNDAGTILVVVGANLAFYSLRDFSQNFAWGPDSRAMLNLCGLLFLLGLALVAGATLFESHHRWLALLCTGGYLCLFTMWIAQQPLSWPFQALTVVGTFLMILGGIFAHLGWKDWRVLAESHEPPQEITLSDLQKNGFGTNRYIRLREFRFCDRSAAEKSKKDAGFNDLWIPVVAVDEQAVQKDGPAPPVPPRVRTVAAYLSLGNPGVGKQPLVKRNPLDVLRKKREEDGHECTVVTGIKKLKPEVKEQLSELAPQTDFAEVIVLDWRKPSSAGQVYGFLGGGGAGLLLGLSALCLVYFRARKVVGIEGWSPPAEDLSQEAETTSGGGSAGA